MIQLEYSTGVGYAINDFVSTKVPIFWGGTAKVDLGIAPHYERNVFHTRRIFALDIGTSAGVYMTRQKDDRFYTASVYPLFRFTFLRARRADIYFAYSVAGPTFISKVLLRRLRPSNSAIHRSWHPKRSSSIYPKFVEKLIREWPSIFF